ncbi:MAG: ATP-binding cassette domain-containing protein [Ruminiclostridium sp.]|nr:ATP-binding cassette domain-containing protein [Ruminiclostridium sp.]
MAIMKIKELRKTYLTHERGSSFLDSLKSLVKRKIVRVEALKGISFDVDEGEMLGLLGPNGAGKSTTLKILTGVLYPTSGEAEIMGYVPWVKRKQYVAGIGAVFGQKSQLIWDIPPLDSFEMNRAIYNIPTEMYKKRLSGMVELLEVGGHVKKPTRQLSLGERMKCEFIMAMLHDPKIVFLDEPTIGLDVIAKERIREFILEMNRKGTTFVLTTHDLDDVEKMARRVIVVNSGEIVYDDNMDALCRFFGNRKLVNLATQKPLPDFSNMSGVFVRNMITPHNAELELDTDILELNQFIKLMNDDYILSDLTMKPPQIESVIKELYITTNKTTIK